MRFCNVISFFVYPIKEISSITGEMLSGTRIEKFPFTSVIVPIEVSFTLTVAPIKGSEVVLSNILPV